jgi:hypothetical protein
MTISKRPEQSITIRWSALYASIYYFLGRAFTDRFGNAGEQALREAIRDYGSYRACQMRLDHQSKGIDLNLANMMNFGDMPNTDSLESAGRTCTPAYFGVTVHDCTLFNAWQLVGGVPIGRIYCEEVHQPLYCEYTKNVTLEMPEFMTKGDGFCTFILTQPGAPETVVPPVVDRDPEAKIARLYGLLFEFLAKRLLDQFGEPGVNALQEATGEHVRQQGETLVAELTAAKVGGVAGKGRHRELFSSAGGRAVYGAFEEMEGEELKIGRFYIRALST